MPRPKLYRDPVHVQIRYDRVDLNGDCPAAGDLRASWVIQRLIDTREFQRLRHIRQNGLTNLVFHGAEHSRFTHSMGVAHLAGEMCRRVARNSGIPVDAHVELATCVAALLHDVGHGPFSHTLEEILVDAGVPFDHELMTQRLLEEKGTELNGVLGSIDPGFPGEIARYIDKKRKGKEWWYKVVSSQLDADRLDYLLRDARNAGLLGSFDLPRLLDSLARLDEQRLAVERGSLEVVEGYLVMLDQMYRIVYYHHTARAASVLLSSTLRRAFDLHRNGEVTVFPSSPSGGAHPLDVLGQRGDAIELDRYVRLGEYQVWALIESWQESSDPVLADLARRLMSRRLFKTMEVDPSRTKRLDRLKEMARALTQTSLPHVDAGTVDYYVTVDEPSRTSYKLYDWLSPGSDESIWLLGGGQSPRAIENEDSEMIAALKKKRYFHRLVFPAEIRDRLLSEAKKVKE
jgi:uncharacterized protein